jgi:molecular chaperone HscA
MAARALLEARVDAARIIDATESALAADAELLAEDERAVLDDAIKRLRRLMEERGTDRRALIEATGALNRAGEDFAGRRMDRSVAQALTGRSIDTLR